MASSADEYRELLSSEMFVELDKLRDIAKHGVPEALRGDVWCYLLGVHHPDKSKEMSEAKARDQDYRSLPVDLLDTSMAARLRGEIKRYQADVDKYRDGDLPKVIEHAISAYVNNHRGVAFAPVMVHICGPLASCISQEAQVYYCFESVMSLLDLYLGKGDANDLMATFTMLFRTVIPDLFNYFEEEDIDNNEWAVSWLSGLLARELPLKCLLRLWDAYFADTKQFSLHIYVCLAVLKKFKDELEDLEHSEILSFLRRLPAMDMDQIITEAYNLKDDVSQSNL